MSKNKRHTKSKRGEEYWSKRPLAGTPISTRPGVNKLTKRLTHKIERQQGKKDDHTE